MVCRADAEALKRANILNHGCVLEERNLVSTLSSVSTFFLSLSGSEMAASGLGDQSGLINYLLLRLFPSFPAAGIALLRPDWNSPVEANLVGGEFSDAVGCLAAANLGLYLCPHVAGERG